MHHTPWLHVYITLFKQNTTIVVVRSNVMTEIAQNITNNTLNGIGLIVVIVVISIIVIVIVIIISPVARSRTYFV